MKKTLLILIFVAIGMLSSANPLEGLLERIDEGASRKFAIKIVDNRTDFFSLTSHDNVICVTANNYISAATGVNWYLNHVAGINICWNQPKAKLPEKMPSIGEPIRKECGAQYRYYLNYCTFSYSMAFWDWERWQQEIDWMALHGVNMSLAAVGTANVWRNMLPRLGFDDADVEAFIAGPAYQPWLLMNNLEGWGGPNSSRWYDEQALLQQQIISRMREFGIEPILPGYSGMLPSTAQAKVGLNAQDSGEWITFQRPSFLLPSDKRFQSVAATYYDELTKLYGKAKYYSIDPFHEMNPTEDNKQEIKGGFDFAKAGVEIMKAMKSANPTSRWIIQGWMENPKAELISRLNARDMLILDLNSDCCPQWGTDKTQWKRKGGYGKFPWLFCMLHNFGGAVGMFGKIETLIDGYYEALTDVRARGTLVGVGATMEAIENNPMMYDLLFELPWRGDKRFSREQWTDEYVFARYGSRDTTLRRVWDIFGRTLYNSRYNDQRVVSAESVFSSRPGVSFEGAWSLAYDPQEVVSAAALMLSVADKYRGNNNFEYDLVNVVRQTLADKGLGLYKAIADAEKRGDRAAVERLSGEFMCALLEQDRLLATRTEFMVGNWINRAKECGVESAEKDIMEHNARTLITVWGNKSSSVTLHDYSHREWSGLLRDLYYKRWATYFDSVKRNLRGATLAQPDYYGLEQEWADARNIYGETPEESAVDCAIEVFNNQFKNNKL